MFRNPFDDAELHARLGRVRAEMAARGLDRPYLLSVGTLSALFLYFGVK